MNLKIFGGTSNKALTDKICEYLKVDGGKIYHHTFPSGELYTQFKINIRGDDVFLIQGMGQGNANENLMQLLIMADAARRSSAARITAVMPMSFYNRQDRKDKSRVPISAKLIMDLIEAAGIDRILTMDLHAPQIQGFTNLPVDVLEFHPILCRYIKSKFTDLELRDNCVIVAPDVGAVKRSEKYSKSLNTGLALIVKTRKGDTEVDISSFVGEVLDKHTIIIDDLTESVGTLIQAAKACKNRGAKSVTCAVTHGCFTDLGCQRLQEAFETKVVDEFFYSDSVGLDWTKIGSYPYNKPESLKEISVSALFAKAIIHIHENKSISELF